MDKLRFSFDNLPQRPLRFVLYALAGLLALSIGFWGYILTLDPETWRPEIEQALSTSTGRKVELGRLRFRTFDGLSLQSDRLVITNPRFGIEGSAQQVRLAINLLPLLWQEVQVRQITLDRMELIVQRDNRGGWSVQDLLNRPVKTQGLSFDPTTSVIQLTRATVAITDQAVTPNREYKIRNLNLRLGGSGTQGPLGISLEGIVIEQDLETVLALEGEVILPKAKEPIAGDVQILLANIQPTAWQEIWLPWLKTQGLTGLSGINMGRLDVDLRWQGQKSGAYSLTGRLGAKAVSWAWKELWGEQPWATSQVILNLDLAQDQGLWEVKPTKITLGDLDVTLQGQVDAVNKTAQIQGISNEFDPYKARDRLPLKLVPPALEPWLITSTGAGNVRFTAQSSGAWEALNTTGALTFLGPSLKTSKMDGDIDAIKGQLLFNEPGRVEFNAVELGLGKTTCLATGELKDGQWNLQLSSTNLDLGRLSGISSAFFPGWVGEWRGRGKLNGNLLGPLANPYFRGALDLYQAEFRERNLTRPVTGISGTIRFEPSVVLFEDLRGEVEGRPLTLTGKVGQGSSLILESERLDLGLVRALLASPLVSRSLQNASRVITRLNGQAQGRIEIAGAQLNGVLALQNATVGLATLGQPLTGVAGRVVLNNGSIDLEGLRGQAGGGSFVFNGTVQNPTGSATLQGALSGNVAVSQALELLPGSMGVSAQGTATYEAAFSPQGGTTLVRIEADLGGVSQAKIGPVDLGGSRLQGAKVTLRAGPGQLEVIEANLDLADGALSGQGQVDNWRSSPRLNLTLNTQPESLTALGATLPWIQELATVAQGQGQLNLRLGGSPKNPNWTGGVRLREVQIPLLGNLSLSGTVLKEGSTYKSSDLTVLWRKNPIDLKGSFTNGPIPQVQFQAQSAELDLEQLLADYGASPLRTWQGTGRLSIRQTQLGRLEVRDLVSTVRLGDVLALSQIEARQDKGTLRGNVTIDLGSNPPTYRGDWNLKAVGLGRVANAWLGWSNARLGTGDLQITFDGQGSTPRAFAQSLTGQGTLTATAPQPWFTVVSRGSGIAALDNGQVQASFTVAGGKSPFSGSATGPDWQGDLSGVLDLDSTQATLDGTLRYLTQALRVRLSGSVNDDSATVIQSIR